ncbi:MAG TPA: HD domain-containing protein [Ilumatobacteraceae bacterium]|nr:HD domain-containing protein [Ilumatobacteraceae bacterium]HRB02896.1 HD domain-containing protein [Ilumatobacteraceae bacterium]
MTSTVSATHGLGAEPTVINLLEMAREAESRDLGRARSMVQQARVMARSRQDEHGEAESLYRLAELSYADGLTNEAFAVALEARDLAHRCGATKSEVNALNLIAAVQYQAANFSEALTSALAALELYRSTNERSSEGLLLNSLAVIQHSLRDTDRAIVTYEAALMANKGQDRPDLDAITLANMAKVRADRHEDLLAVSLGESALELARVHSSEFVPEILARLAIAYVSLSALDRATCCLDEADGVLRDRTVRRVALSPGSVVTVRTARGDLYVAQHLRDHALREWNDALELAMQAGMTEVALTLREKLAHLCKEMGRFETALMHQEARYALTEELFSRGADLRIRTLQIQHETETARQQSEILRLRTSQLEALVTQRTDQMEVFLVESLRRVAVLAEFKDTAATAHPVRVGDLAAEMAVEMGETTEFVDRLRLAARLHDIGKVAVADAVLFKPGALTAAEFETIKTHTTLGAEMLADSPSPLIQLAAELAATHHERWDGTGYPNGLVGEAIPLSGRIVTVADVYDALISARVYKHAWSSVDAVNYVIAGSGSQFDPRIVHAFIVVMTRRDPSLMSLLDLSALA